MEGNKDAIGDILAGKDKKKGNVPKKKDQEEKEEMVNFGARISTTVSNKFKLAVFTRQGQALEKGEKKPFVNEVFEEMVEYYAKKLKL